MRLSATRLAVLSSPFERRRGGGAVPASIIEPPDQTIFTVSTARTITASATAELFADGVSIGTASPSLSWSPSAVDNDVSIRAGASGAPVKAAVTAADNGSLWDISSYSKTNVTVTGGQADPFGGTSAYKVVAVTSGVSKNYRFSKSATGTPATANSSIEVWVSPIGNLLPVIRLYPLNSYAEIDPITNGVYCNITTPNTLCSVSVVEKKEVGGRMWYRLWFRGEWGTTLSTFFVDFKNGYAAAGENVIVSSGEHGFYIYRPRYIDGALPFYDYQRYGARFSDVTLGVSRYITTTPYHDGTVTTYMKVLVPDSYDANRAQPYKVCVLCPVEPTPGSSSADELQVIKTAGLHNTHDMIFVSYSSHTSSSPWGGARSNGRYDNHRILLSLADAARKFFNLSTNRNDRYLLGYSKGGFAAYSVMIKSPGTFKAAAAWDVPWTQSYASMSSAGFGVDLQFGDEATFLQYQPYNILPSNLSSVNDKKRLVIGAGSTFTSQTAPMVSLMQSNGIEFDEIAGLTGVTHNADAAWITPMLQAMLDLG